jgi:uncharacterized protein
MKVGQDGRTAASRLGQLVLGLAGFALAITLFIRSHIGLGPWDAFHYGMHLQTGITVGAASIAAGLAIVAATTLMGVRPGIATVLNMVLIGIFTDALMLVIPDADTLALGIAYFAAGVPLVGISSGLYIGAGYGHGPRDALMVALVQRTGWSVRRIRTAIELSALAAGWVMGGTIGVGTLILALTAGHSVQWGLRLFKALPEPSGA